MASEKKLTAASVFKLIEDCLQAHLKAPGGLAVAKSRFEECVEEEQQRNVEGVLASSYISYRDGLLIQLAYGLQSPTPLDLTKRQDGARSVAQKLGAFFAAHHIRSVRDAYQNIAKNTSDLTRGNLAAFDDFLRWSAVSERTHEELESALEYAAAAVAATARPVEPMPELGWAKLSFAAVCQLLDDLFSVGSEGAFEQFAVAALLSALIDQNGQTGYTGYRIETKSLNASDRSSRTAGDIQILSGSQVVEAFEVTAGSWSRKLDVVKKTIKEHDLSRFHVVAHVPEAQRPAFLGELKGCSEDISLLDIKGFSSALVSALRRRHRASALQRLYEFLGRYQPDVERVNKYVALLKRSGLTA